MLALVAAAGSAHLQLVSGTAHTDGETVSQRQLSPPWARFV